MPNVIRFQPHIYRTVDSIKIFWFIPSFYCFCSFIYSWKCTLWLINWVQIKISCSILCQSFNDKRVIIDINCNPLVERKRFLLLCRGGFYCVNSEKIFRYFTTSFRRSWSSPLNRITKHHSLRHWMSFLGQLRMNCFRSLREIFWNIGRIETFRVLIFLKFCFFSSW